MVSPMALEFTLTVWDVLNAFIYILPAYIANASPVILGGGTPLDFGKNFIDGRRIFGDHKTIRGLLSGILFGTLTGIIVYFITQIDARLLALTLSDALMLAFLLSIGTHIGDLLGSFIKRRLNLKPGAPFVPMDQVGFLIFAILVAYPFYPLLNLAQLLLLLIVTPLVHVGSNVIAWLLKLKEHPW